jgi:hypothetical protein
MRYLIALLALGACAKADVLVVDPTPRQAIEADSVRVYLDQPTIPYTVIALVEVDDQGWGMSMESLAKRMRQDAAKLGGEGVIIGQQSSTAGSVIIPVGNLWYAGAMEQKKLVGQVITFR